MKLEQVNKVNKLL